ncbi:hypothetical protein CLF_106882 [Clonorchis sinensis]|uniref:Uncharacterized protein n=1 Tax=Clonorchis sinensis TaxID=79923 RepID=G7YQ86_CLOSI|nr:hypothetical protein CLF_106882 [Clonorchis sinensis]
MIIGTGNVVIFARSPNGKNVLGNSDWKMQIDYCNISVASECGRSDSVIVCGIFNNYHLVIINTSDVDRVYHMTHTCITPASQNCPCYTGVFVHSISRLMVLIRKRLGSHGGYYELEKWQGFNKELFRSSERRPCNLSQYLIIFSKEAAHNVAENAAIAHDRGLIRLCSQDTMRRPFRDLYVNLGNVPRNTEDDNKPNRKLGRRHSVLHESSSACVTREISFAYRNAGASGTLLEAVHSTTQTVYTTFRDSVIYVLESSSTTFTRDFERVAHKLILQKVLQIRFLQSLTTHKRFHRPWNQSCRYIPRRKRKIQIVKTDLLRKSGCLIYKIRSARGAHDQPNGFLELAELERHVQLLRLPWRLRLHVMDPHPLSQPHNCHTTSIVYRFGFVISVLAWSNGNPLPEMEPVNDPFRWSTRVNMPRVYIGGTIRWFHCVNDPVCGRLARTDIDRRIAENWESAWSSLRGDSSALIPKVEPRNPVKTSGVISGQVYCRSHSRIVRNMVVQLRFSVVFSIPVCFIQSVTMEFSSVTMVITTSGTVQTSSASVVVLIRKSKVVLAASYSDIRCIVVTMINILRHALENATDSVSIKICIAAVHKSPTPE